MGFILILAFPEKFSPRIFRNILENTYPLQNCALHKQTVFPAVLAVALAGGSSQQFWSSRLGKAWGKEEELCSGAKGLQERHL